MACTLILINYGIKLWYQKVLDLSSITSYIYKVLDQLRLLINDKRHRYEIL